MYYNLKKINKMSHISTKYETFSTGFDLPKDSIAYQNASHTRHRLSSLCVGTISQKPRSALSFCFAFYRLKKLPAN